MTYPPEPWNLQGQMYVSFWRVPPNRLPGELPPGTQPLLLGGRGVVGTAWVIYEAGGDLAYNEVMATVLVRRGSRPAVCITHIWVDSEPSLEGGRALWGIPKKRATFDLATSPGLAADARTAGGSIAATFRSGTHLPGVWPLRFTVTQLLHGRRKDTPVRCRSQLERATAHWEIDASGPLAWLRGHRPFLSLQLRDFQLRFGN